MKTVKKYSSNSFPLILPFGKVMVSVRNVYTYNYQKRCFVSYSHTEFCKLFYPCRKIFVDFVKKTFPKNNVNYKL